MNRWLTGPTHDTLYLPRSGEARQAALLHAPGRRVQGMEAGGSSDGILLQGIVAGDSDALLALHKRYVNLVYSMARHVLQDAGLAEEVTQDVFLKLWQKSQRYDPGRGQFPSWLLSVTRFAAIDRLRREGRRPARG